MMRNQRALGLIGLLVGLAWCAAEAQAKDYLLTQPGSGRPTGARLQIGTGLPLPVGPDGIFEGGKMSTTGSNMAMTAITGPKIWPHDINTISGQALIKPVPAAMPGCHPNCKKITQDLATAQGGNIKIPATVLTDKVQTAMHVTLGTVYNPRHGGVFNTNNAVYDVATTISYEWPTAVATFGTAGGPAPATLMGPGGGTIIYSGGAFGGPAIFAVQPGPGAGSRTINPPNAMGHLPIATVFINAGQGTPHMVGVAGIVAASTMGMTFTNMLVTVSGMAAQGAPLTAVAYTTSFGMVPMAVHPVNMGGVGTMCTMWCAGNNGTIMGIPNEQDNLTVYLGSNPPGTTIKTWSVGAGVLTNTHNNATTEGFPWTTGFITVIAPGALGGETFYLEGADNRGTGTMQGVGNISLVSGSLSQRNLSKANANRAFLSLNLPEPSAALGAAGALGMLALCHALVRRRSR